MKNPKVRGHIDGDSLVLVPPGEAGSASPGLLDDLIRPPQERWEALKSVVDSGCRETHFGQPCCQVHRPVVRYSFDRQNSRHAVFGSSPVSTYVKSPFDS